MDIKYTSQKTGLQLEDEFPTENKSLELHLSACCKLKGKNYKAITHNKLNTYDWLGDIPDSEKECEFVEVQFKNTRKGYFRNSLELPLSKGDLVAVESNPGHDVGEVTMTGRLVLLQMKKNGVKLDVEIKRVYRKQNNLTLRNGKNLKLRSMIRCFVHVRLPRISNLI